MSRQLPFSASTLRLSFYLGRTILCNEDQAMQLLLKEQVENSQVISEQWLTELVKKIQAGSNEEVLHLLSELHPHDDEPALQEKLTQLIFACEMLGRLSVEAEDE